MISALQHYAWPGNSRELRNTMEYALAFANGNQIRWSDLPDEIRYPERFQLTGGTATASPVAATPPAASGNPLAGARRVAERDLLLAALDATNNNRTKAAAALGVSRMTLYKRMDG